MEHREKLVDNLQVERDNRQPTTPEGVQQKIAEDYSDFCREEIEDTARGVDETHKQQIIERRYASNEYSVYEAAA